MKDILLTIILVLVCLASYAQVPETINFQAQARGSDGKLLESKPVKTRFSVLETSSSGSPIYIETHDAITDNSGLYNLNIGGGTIIQGDFSTINWSIQPKFLKVEVDAGDGTGFKLISTFQLTSVPFAFYAAKADTSMRDSDKQNLSLSGSELTISNGNSVTLPNTSKWTDVSTDPNLLGIKYTDAKTGTYEFSNGTPTPGGVSVGLAIRNSKNTLSSWSFLNLVSSSTSPSANRSSISFINPFSNYSIETRDSTMVFNRLIGTGGFPIFQYRPDFGYRFEAGKTYFSQRLGIGTNNFPTDVASPLQIRGIDSQNMDISDLIQFNDESDNRRWHLALEKNTDLNFVQTGISQDRFYLKANGNVGIGTRNPDSKLSVMGWIESTLGGFKFPDGTLQTTASSQINTAGDGSGVSVNKSLSISAEPGTTYTRVSWRRLQNNATDSLLYHFVPGQWYYFAVSKKSTGEAIIYINGREMFRGNHANEAFSHSTLNIAASFFTAYGNFFNGTIDGIRVSNISKSTTQINQYWASNTDFAVEANTFALWKFDEGAGSIINSSIGSHTGNLVGNPQWVTGKFGNALSFDGIDDYGVSNLGLPTANVTYEAWVKFNATSNPFSTILQPYGMFNLGLDLAQSTAKNNEGLILQSPNGNCWKITIDNSGNLVKAPISCSN
ncbi:MAG: hypothetical protein JNL53_20370 [Cyclobacteriaceae bacterium]|nr:hypothetical protein [Cyclobacteriaceae bacterium]